MLAVGAVEQARAAAQEHRDDVDLHLVETEFHPVRSWWWREIPPQLGHTSLSELPDMVAAARTRAATEEDSCIDVPSARRCS